MVGLWVGFWFVLLCLFQCGGVLFSFLLKLVFALNVYDFCNRGDQIKVNCFKKEFRWVVSRKEN